MKRKSAQALIAFFACGMSVSFLAVMIFQISVSKQTQQVTQTISTLTDSNSQVWATSPGANNLTITNSFQLFSLPILNGTRGLPDNPNLSLLPQKHNYTFYFEYRNKSYQFSTPGYLSFVPYFEYIPQFDQSNDDPQEQIKHLNLVAIQNFYKGVNSPLMYTIPQYLYVMLNSLQNDFLLSYYTQAVYKFYIYDQLVVNQTIFYLASLSDQQKVTLWEDPIYGWSSQDTFTPWIRYALLEPENLNGIYSTLMSHFQLTYAQMDILVGENSQVRQIISAVTKSISDAISAQNENCKDLYCEMWELAAAQWGKGYLTSLSAFPNMILQPGGYAILNDTIPNYNDDPNQAFEFYLQAEEYQMLLDIALQITRPDVEIKQSLFNFATIDYIVNNIDNVQRIISILILNTGDDESDIMLGQEMISYLGKVAQWVQSGIPHYLSLQGWKFLGRMNGEGSYLLLNGIHAKALYYQKLDCKTVFANYATIQGQVCGNPQLDFTQSATSGLRWIDALIKINQTKGTSFLSLLNSIGCTEDQLSKALWTKTELLYTTFLKVAQSISKFNKCQSTNICSSDELWKRQHFDGSVTNKLPTDLGFQDTDKVNGIADWGLNDQTSTHYELYSYFTSKNIPMPFTQEQVNSLLTYNSGGILGYYSLRNLTEFVYKPNGTLHPAFTILPEQAHLLVDYVKYNLLNYQYGGETVETSPLNYLWDYNNKYTEQLKTLNPLDEGINWRPTGSQLFETNNRLFYSTTNYNDIYEIDTGIKNIKKVRQMVKTLGEKQIKAKRMIYYSPNSTQAYYHYPQSGNVSGTEGYGYEPNVGSDGISKLYKFDWQLYQTINLTKTDKQKYFNFDTFKYIPQNNLISLNPMENYPIYVTLAPSSTPCFGQINGGNCTAELNNLFANDVTLVEKVSGFVVSQTQTYLYWINMAEISDLYPLPQQNANNTYIPIAVRTVNLHYNQTQMQNLLGDVNDLSKDRKIYFIVTFVSAGLFFLLLAYSIWYYRKNRNNFDDLGDAHSNQVGYVAVAADASV